jgi:ornithine carbamoyltransferase
MKPKNYKNFLDIADVSSAELRQILNNAKLLKAEQKQGKAHPLLAGKHLAMIFEKASTRTRVSFEVGINQLGGQGVLITADASQIGRGEPIADTANVLSRFCDLIMIRTFKHQTLLDLAKNASVPVINGLTDHSHPCQIMADIQTVEENIGDITGKKIAWFGDYNNVTQSWAEAAEKLGFELIISAPAAIFGNRQLPKNCSFEPDAKKAAANADVITTDTWISMGEADSEAKKQTLQPYQVNSELMQLAKSNAIFLHCLPAHRGEEVTENVIDGPQSRIYDEAENRLHAQKAIMCWCFGD